MREGQQIVHLLSRSVELAREELQHLYGQRPDRPREATPLPPPSQLQCFEPVLPGRFERTLGALLPANGAPQVELH